MFFLYAFITKYGVVLRFSLLTGRKIVLCQKVHFMTLTTRLEDKKLKKHEIRKLILIGMLSMVLFLFLSLTQTSTVDAASDWTIHHSADLGFDSIYKAGDEYIIGKKDGKVAIWNQTTKKIVVSDYNFIYSIWDINNAVVYKSVGKDLYEFVTMDCRTGKITNKLGKYSELSECHIIDEYNGNIISVLKKNNNSTKIGVINKHGKVLIPVKYDEIEHIGSDHDYTGKNAPIYYLKCGKKTNGKMIYALYQSDGTQLTECKYTELYTNIYDASLEFYTAASSYVLAKNKEGHIGIINNGKEIGFNNTLTNISKDSVYRVESVICEEQEYIVKCIYETADIYDNADPIYNSGSWNDKEHNLSTLSKNLTGVSYECFDLNGNKVSKDIIIQKLSCEIQAHETLKNTTLAAGLKKVNQLDFHSLFTGRTGLTITKTEINDKGEFICDGSALSIKITLTCTFKDKYGDENDMTYDAIAYFDMSGKLIQYGLLLGGDSERCLIRYQNDEIHWLDKYRNIDKVIFTDTSKRYYDNVSNYGIIVLKEDSNRNMIFDDDTGFAVECYGENISGAYHSYSRSSTNTNRKMILIEKKQNDYYINQYDSNWKLIKSSELTGFGTEFRAYYQENEATGALVIYNDDKYLAVLPNGKSIQINRTDDKLFDSIDTELCYAKGKYYVKCHYNHNDTSEYGIYCLNDKKFIFRYDRNKLKIDLEDDYIVVKDKFYWTYSINDNGHRYYGLIDETGSIVVDAISNKYNLTQQVGGRYRYIRFRDMDGNESYYYGNPLKKHSEKPEEKDIIDYRVSLETYYDKIVYYHMLNLNNYHTIDYIYDTNGSLLVKSSPQKDGNRSMAIFEKTKTIIIADSFWEGRPNVTTNKQIPALKAKIKDASGTTYTVTKSSAKKGTVAFTKPKNNKVTSVNIPAKVKINGITYKVTSISDKAFMKCTKLKKVVIPSSVTKLGKKAFFGCKNLKNIAIKSDKLKKKNIGQQAFKGISKKATIKVPKKMKKSYTKWLKSKGIPKTVTIK